jgi:hypothetical protein
MLRQDFQLITCIRPNWVYFTVDTLGTPPSLRKHFLRLKSQVRPAVGESGLLALGNHRESLPVDERGSADEETVSVNVF